MGPCRRLLASLLAPLALAACEHAAPGAVHTTADVGPFTDTLPRRLTFHLLNDLTPSVGGGVLVYSYQGDAYPNPGYSPIGREGCLAFLPVEGGTIQRLLCPHTLLSPADTFVTTWFEPSLSPDGSRLAFTWQRGPNVGALGFVDADLVVAPVGRPGDASAARFVVNYAESGTYPRRATHAARISWLSGERLRLLAVWENIFKVKGGGADRATDTTYEPLALMELDLTTRTLTAVPGGDSVVAYAAAPTGGIWVVRESRRDSLLLLDPATGVRTPVGSFSTGALDLIALDGAPVAIVDSVVETGPVCDYCLPVHGGAAIERIDPATGARTRLTDFAGPVRHIAAVGGRRLVAEIEQGSLPFGAPSDLWLLEFPPP